MTVNQKIKKSLKRGDQKKLSEILGVRNQAIAERLNADKEIDSVDFINAVCKITGKSFSYFRPIEGYDNTDETRLSEDKPVYGKYAQQKVDQKDASYWKEKFEMAREHITLLEQNIKAKDELIKQLKVNIDLKKSK